MVFTDERKSHRMWLEADSRWYRVPLFFSHIRIVAPVQSQRCKYQTANWSAIFDGNFFARSPKAKLLFCGADVSYTCAFRCLNTLSAVFAPRGVAGLQEHRSSSQQQDFLSQRQGFHGWTIIITSSTGSTIWVGSLSVVQKLPSSAFSLGGKGSSSSPNSPLLGLKVWVQRNRNCFYFHQLLNTNVRFSSVSDDLPAKRIQCLASFFFFLTI